MSTPAKVRRSWRYYALRSAATLFILSGAIALRVLMDQFAGGRVGVLVQGLVSFLILMATIWVTMTIWDYDWGAETSKKG